MLLCSFIPNIQEVSMSMQEWVTDVIKSRKWALMDIEYIRISSSHRCIRKLYIVTDDGVTDMECEFYPCVRLKDLEKKYQRLFHLCHKLPYDPKQLSPECYKSLKKINEFIISNNIEVILYKGLKGILNDIYYELRAPAIYNIECFSELDKVKSLDPRQEVNSYFRQLIELV